MKQLHSHKWFGIIASVVFLTVLVIAQNSTIVWDEKRETQYLQNRQDSTKWDLNLLKKDLERNKETVISKPFAFGAFPIPKYELLGKDSFKGVGNGGEFSGLDLNGKKILYSYFLVNKNAINQKFIGDKPNEVFFTIVVLTDFVDATNFTHAGVHIISRNNPDFIGQGFFKTKNDEIDYTAFLTAERDEYAIVNMRLFNLKHGRTVLIAPQKDGSLRSIQIANPILSDKEIKAHIEKLLKQDDVKKFFTDDGNI
jgi:hypothetical protein